jgi:hypothetical protein
MADFLASIAKNYKGDPFGAGMGLMKAREATNFDPQKEKSFWDFRDTPLEGSVLDVVGTKEKIKAEEARRKVMEDRTGWSFEDLVKFGLSKGAPKNDHLRAANIGMAELMKGSGPPPQPGATDRFGKPIESKEILEFRKGITDRDEMLAQREELKKQIDDAKLKTEEEAAFLDSPKGRLQTLWADADKRDAILGGITDAMTEVKFGEDAYQSRFHDTQKKVRQNLRVAEATKLARQKAQLDMMKVAAETSALANPAQYMTTSQKDAMAIVNASGLKPGSPEWNQAYATQLQQIVVKDLTSAKASALTPLYTFAKLLLASKDATEKLTGETMIKAIESIAGYLAGTDTGGKFQNINEIVVKEKETETETAT